MISIIICSRSKTLNPEFKNNIEETIGIEHEFIVIDNSENRYNIFEAYNQGVAQSSYPYLCFMHDDITYHTNNWGSKISKHFEDERTGAIGIAGSPYAAQMPGSWWGGGLVSQYILPVENADDQPEIISTYRTAGNRNEVVMLDGVWLCIRKSLFGKIRFDDKSYSGFHFYDVDISLQIHQSGYKLYSIFDVLIRHYTIGRMDKSWCENAAVFNKKWLSKLPISCLQLTYFEKCEAELKTLKEYVYNLLYNNYPLRNAYKLGILKLLAFPYSYFYYKTAVLFLRYCFKYIFNSSVYSKV